MTNQELIKILSGMLKVPSLTKKELLEHMAIEQVIEMLKSSATSTKTQIIGGKNEFIW